MNKLIIFLQKYLPTNIKVILGNIINKNISLSNYIYLLFYLHRNQIKQLNFGVNGKLHNILTISSGNNSNIRFRKINFNFIKSNSIDSINVNNFISELEDIHEIEKFIQECSRILKKDKKIFINFVDILNLIKVYRNESVEVSDELRRKYGAQSSSPSQVDLLNTILFSLHNSNVLLDSEKIKNILVFYGFNLIKVNTIGIFTEIIAIKSLNDELFSNVATELPTSSQISSNLDWPAYFGFCDPLWIIQRIDKLSNNAHSKLENRSFYSVIGSMFFINLLPILKPKKLILFDISEYQVRYMKILQKIFSVSLDYKHFLSLVFSRPFSSDFNVFISQNPDYSILNYTRQLVKDKIAFDQTIGKIANAIAYNLSDDIKALKIENNSMCQSITILEKDRFKPGPGMNVFYFNETLSKHFNFIKNCLTSADIFTSALQDDKIVKPLQEENGIIYVTNIGEEDWLHGLTTKETLDQVMKNAHGLSRAFQKQWRDSYLGFQSFIKKIHAQFWIIDSTANVFSSSELLLARSDAHSWLLQKTLTHTVGKTIEIIHTKTGTWGFKEEYETQYYKDYLKNKRKYETVILHILLGNGVELNDFINILDKSSRFAKKILILEHNPYGINKTVHNPSIGVDGLLSILNSINNFNNAHISVDFSGTTSIDNNKYGEIKEMYRNFLIICDL